MTKSSSFDGNRGKNPLAMRTPARAPRRPCNATPLWLAHPMKPDSVVLIAASAANAGPGFVAAITKSTCSNAARYHVVRAHALRFGDRGTVEVVTRTRQPEPDGQLVGELGRAARPAAAEIGEQCREVANHPIHREVREIDREVDLPHARCRDQLHRRRARSASSTPGSRVTPPRFGTIATLRPSSSCVPKPASQFPGDGMLDGSRRSGPAHTS